MSKSYFGLLDCRNTKYQGLINDDMFAGVGILVDQTFTFALSTWKSSTLNGHSLIIYPNLDIFFGEIQNNQPKGIFCFQLNQNEKLIINSQNTNSKFPNQKSTIAYVLSLQCVVELQRNCETNEYKVIQVSYTKNEHEEQLILSKIFQNQFSKDKINLTSYLNKNFIETNTIFELSGKNQLFFGFKDTISLGFKMQSNSPFSIGFFKPFPRNLIFGRKVNYNIALPTKTQIQEGYFEPYPKTFNHLIQKKSSLQFQKLSQDYFKKSTTFRNQFVPLDQLVRIHEDIKSISEAVRFEATKKFGQSLLENNFGSTKQNENDVVIKEYTLEEMKQEIYKAAAKKQRSHINLSTSPIRQLEKKSSESLYLNSINSQGNHTLTVRKSRAPELIDNSTEMMSRRMNENTPLVQNRRKGFSYHQSKKEDLIKGVNQIVKNIRESEEALLKQLIKEKPEEKPFSSKREYNYSGQVDQLFDENKKYQRYEPKITPFKNLNGLNSNAVLDPSNKKRQSQYSHLQKAQQEQVSFFDMGMQESIRGDKQMDGISTLQLDRKKINSKSFANLSKYKERHRQVTHENLNQREKNCRFKYLENVEDQIKGNLVNQRHLNAVPQIKLFGERKNVQKQQNSAYIQLEKSLRLNRYKNENLDKSIYLQNQSLTPNRFSISSKPLDVKSFNEKEYQANAQVKIKLKKNYSRQMLSDIENQSGRNQMEANKKLKKTFHYVD